MCKPIRRDSRTLGINFRMAAFRSSLGVLTKQLAGPIMSILLSPLLPLHFLHPYSCIQSFLICLVISKTKPRNTHVVLSMLHRICQLGWLRLRATCYIGLVFACLSIRDRPQALSPRKSLGCVPSIAERNMGDINEELKSKQEMKTPTECKNRPPMVSHAGHLGEDLMEQVGKTEKRKTVMTEAEDQTRIQGVLPSLG